MAPEWCRFGDEKKGLVDLLSGRGLEFKRGYATEMRRLLLYPIVAAGFLTLEGGSGAMSAKVVTPMVGTGAMNRAPTSSIVQAGRFGKDDS